MLYTSNIHNKTYFKKGKKKNISLKRNFYRNKETSVPRVLAWGSL
jgi:hypothetical protein